MVMCCFLMVMCYFLIKIVRLYIISRIAVAVTTGKNDPRGRFCDLHMKTDPRGRFAPI